MHGEARIGMLDETLLRDPLAFLSAEHARQRALLGHLERLARQPGGPAHGPIARALAAWFACELPLHVADEEDSVYPRLGVQAARRYRDLTRCPATAPEARATLRAALAAIATGHPPADGFAETALAFVAAYRRHLTIEEEEIMPLARRSLRGAVCSAIAREMAARRHLGAAHG
jgi:hemerythrin-like domain-containing protein